jgi:hypothetical protein
MNIYIALCHSTCNATCSATYKWKIYAVIHVKNYIKLHVIFLPGMDDGLNEKK